MEVTSDKVTGIRIAYVGGGSRGWAWMLMKDLALEPQLSGTVYLYDIDYQATRDNASIGNSLSQKEDSLGKWKYEVVRTLDEALRRADFVVLSILPGTFQEMHTDVHLPEKYGIYQSVGDTTGPGGLMRGLRTIPIYREIARKIRDCCPKAWVINYTNPMSMCVRTLYKEFPEIKAFGCCHEVFSTQTLLAEVVREMRGIDGISRKEIKVNLLGINHFAWIDRASYKNIDLYPLYQDFVERHYLEGYELHGPWRDSYFSLAEKVKFDLFRRYGLIATGGDRHLAEFMPSSHYLKDPEMVEEWKFHLTPVKWRVENSKAREELQQRLLKGEENIELSQSGEEGVQQIKALVGLGELVTNVNLPNRGQIDNIPGKMVVETNAFFSYDSVRPIWAGSLPAEINALIARHIFNQEAIVEAAFSGDKSRALQAFLNDPLVTIEPGKASSLFHEMLESTQEYLPPEFLSSTTR